MITYLIIALCALQAIASVFMQEWNIALMSVVALFGWIAVKRYERLVPTTSDQV